MDIDIGYISEALNDKLDRNGLNAGNPCAVVIETSPKEILPSWYRVYSDGWCEQGGYINSPVYHGWYTVNLLKQYIDTNYMPILTRVGAYDANVWGSHTNFIMSISTNIFQIATSSEGGGLGQIKWYACGYIR